MTRQNENKVEQQPQPEACVLLIDDDPHIINLLKHSLRGDGYEIIACMSGTEGVEAALSRSPAVIVCDLMMPDMDGIEVCKRIKGNEALKLSYFILLTAKGDVANKVHALDSGADDFIHKPPDLREFRARVRAGMRIFRLTAELQAKKTEMEFDLAQAREYITSILPEPFQMEHGSGLALSIGWRYLPSAQLGGDIFNYQWLDRETLAIYLVDVSGHGIGSALLSVSVLNMLRTRSVAADLLRPGAVLSALNLAFPMGRQNNLFFTMWYGVLSLKDRRLYYASAGHPPSILTSKNGRNILLSTPGVAIGMLPRYDYEEQSIRIDSSCLLTVFSDGLYDSGNRQGKIQTMGDWLSIVEKQPSLSVPFAIQQNLDYLVAAGKKIAGTASFEDDASAIQLAISMES